MKLSTTIAAAAIATMPVVASAALVTILDGGTTLVTMGDVYQFDVVTNAGDFQHTFTVASDSAGIASVSLNDIIAPFFDGVSVEWSVGGVVVANGGEDDLVSTTFTDPGSLTQLLTISWAEAPADSTFDGAVSISSVPVPAGLLLMGTALAGFGVLRRKG